MGFAGLAKRQQSLAGLLGATLGLGFFTTAQTVVIGTPEQMAASAAGNYGEKAMLLKIKLDARRLISERMVAIRSAVPEATLIVDANESWRPEAGGALPLLADSECRDVEQTAARAG